MAIHGEKSNKLSHSVMDSKGPVDTIKRAGHETQFVGYTKTESTSEVKYIVADGTLEEAFEKTGESAPAVLVLEETPFYGESGGQVGDSGTISGDGFEFCVTDTQKDGAVFLHQGYLVSGSLKTGATAKAVVNTDRRDGIRRAHSATHVLHYALQKNLGTHAQQQGSKVDEDWLRFDFTNMSPVDAEQLAAIESDVHAQVGAGQAIQWDIVPLADAREAGAMMLFGEKYPDPVRMVSMGDFSKELCGGTHLDNTSAVGEFEITAEEGVSAGTRRIVALTGARAAEHGKLTREQLSATAKLLGVSPLQTPDAVNGLMQKVRDLKKQLSSGSPPLMSDVTAMEEQVAQLAKSGDSISADALLGAAAKIGDADVIVKEIPGGNTNLMRQLIDQIRKKTDSSAILLAATQGDSKVTLVAGVSKDLVEKGASAGNWVKEVAPVVGGGGGGKPDMAQAGGKNPAELPAALDKALEVIQGMLSA